jgi:probable F420-dependent oxidoreductase
VRAGWWALPICAITLAIDALGLRINTGGIPLIKLDTQLGQYDLGLVPAEAQRMERLGFDCLWSFETSHDPFLPLAFAAQATQTLRIGTNIAVAFARTPFATAMAAWDLARASGGRFTLGLGTQVRAHNERRFSVPWVAPAARVKEYIQCVRAIWDTWQTGARPAFKGEYYQFTLSTPVFAGGPIAHPAIPIFLAGVNPLMARTGGTVADGFHVHPMHSVKYLKEVLRPSIDEGAKTRGKRVDDVTLCAPVFLISGETEEERSGLERLVREQIAFYASTPNYRGVLDLHGWAEVGEKLSGIARAGDFKSLAAGVPDAMLDAFAVSATPDKAPAVLAERYRGLVQRIGVYFPISPSHPDARWTRFAAAFRKAAKFLL